ncbi:MULTISPECIES: LPP20 family lipoprotein [Pseudoalteromonas]|uniref:LPP20 family lipoprotein n=1 Tax=Pseudoalteromonas TaxID=53246 RepID=UPI0007847CAA|nr:MULTISPECIES: LPP20 family lipoprotein [Pseudoalteromonas]MCF7498522.1 LPP20 family lipoprotein [Pseudoalteromonas sp. L1]MCF7517034.1 LPP20 family lipoprotein [Pseudoalteromonas sp. L21]UJX24707.1 LPP20 family lipoprotein [Pseudoalteromonas sp. CF6-2]
MRAMLVCGLAACIALSGCSSIFDKHVEYTYIEPDDYPILKAVGYAPISAQPSDNKSQRTLLAIKASKLEAYRELAEQVYGQKISAGTTVQNSIAHNDQLQSKVQGVIKGAQVIKTYAVGDTYATELQLDMKRVHDLYIGEIKPREVKKVTYY